MRKFIRVQLKVLLYLFVAGLLQFFTHNYIDMYHLIATIALMTIFDVDYDLHNVKKAIK